MIREMISEFVMAVLVVLAIAAGSLVLVAAGCAECRAGDTRCSGAKAQECNSREEWTTVEDCASVTPGAWVCCDVAEVWEGEEIAGCVPGGCDGGVR